MINEIVLHKKTGKYRGKKMEKTNFPTNIDVFNNYVVTKSNRLIQAKYNLSVTEQKVILFLVSQIRKEDDALKTYTLSIKEFNELLGNKGTPKYTELRKITKKMMGKPLEIYEDGKWKQISWISYVEYNPNEGSVNLGFDPRLKPYLLHLKREFTSYKLRNVLKLKSSYSIRIYEMLKQWQTVKKLEISLEKLRELLQIQDKYKEYHNIKKRVLNTAKKEINENTDISIDFEEIKKGRTVVGLCFHITSKPVLQLPILEQENVNSNTPTQEGDIEEFQVLGEESEGSIPEENSGEIDYWFESLYHELQQMFEKHNVEDLPKDLVKNWLKDGEEKWGSRKYVEIKKLAERALSDHRITNPIGFITYMVRKEETNEKKKPIRVEPLPDWYDDYKKQVEKYRESLEAKNN